MAYNDPRRATLASVLALRHPSQSLDDASLLLWVRVDEQGAAHIDRRVTGLRQHQIVAARKQSHYSNGRKVYGPAVYRLTLRDVETGEERHLTDAGGGATVWRVHP